MANSEHLAILKQGVEAWNRWRVDNPEVIPNLNAVTLAKADLRGANFALAHFGSTPLDDESSEKRYEGASLTGADFSGCDLRGAHFEHSFLFESTFENADCRDAIFYSGILQNTSFAGARLEYA